MYYVFVEGKSPPTKAHLSPHDAEIEAARLAMLSDNRDRDIYVFKLYSSLVTVRSHQYIKEA